MSRARTGSRATRVVAGAFAPLGIATAYSPSLRHVLLPAHGHCLFLSLTGWQCPVCGMTRASLALAHGHWMTALKFNALTPLVVLLALAATVSATSERAEQFVGGVIGRVWRSSGSLLVMTTAAYLVGRNVF